MTNELNTMLLQAKEKLVRRDRLNNRLQLVLENYNSEKNRFQIQKSRLMKEEADVIKLESLSVTGLFYTILGSKEKQIEKERQEYLEAKLKYDECKYSLNSLQTDIVTLENNLKQYKDIEVEYQRLLKEKETKILNANNQHSFELTHLLDAISETKANMEEIEEALEIGIQVNKSLERVKNSLESAQGWGVWDMFGGGFIATAAKHSYIDNAQRDANEAQSLLRRFERELQDINLSSRIEIDISSFSKFADYFFDGLISDWIVQSKINSSLENTLSVNGKVSDVLSLLKEKKQEAQETIYKLEDKMAVLIENV